MELQPIQSLYSEDKEWFKTRLTCRNCDSKKLSKVLDLGKQYPIGFVDSEALGVSRKLPLCLVMCRDCNLVQLKDTVSPKLLFGGDYWYRSGVNQSMKDELYDIMTSSTKMVDLMPGDLVVDIGCNDGTLLNMFPPNVRKIGYEPSNAYHDAWKNIGTHPFTILFNDFFDVKVLPSDTRAKIITAIAMFYDLDNPHQFLRQVKQILHPDGVFVVQMNYLGKMINNNAFDNISHEHLCYYSVKTFAKLLVAHDLEIVNVEFNDINGGSFRCYIKRIPIEDNSKKDIVIHGPHEFNEKVLDTIVLEGYLIDPETYREFASRIRQIRRDVVNFLREQKKHRNMIVGYGASTRGFVLIQYFKLDRFFDKIADVNPAKWGKKLVGTDITIISEKDMRVLSPAYLFILPWYFGEDFIQREKKFLRGGGQFVFPLPHLIIHASA